MLDDHDYNHSLPLPLFDRDLDLEDLLSGIDKIKLMQSVGDLLGVPVRLVSSNGKLSYGVELDAVHARVPICTELEPVAFLEVQSEAGEKIGAAAGMIEMLLRSTARYLMTSDLHLEAVRTDYDELQKKHEALMESEKKYRELSENLELRVQEQVKIIENSHRQLYAAEKMASVGQLAAGVAHEINNPMAFIYSNLLASQDYVDDIAGIAQLIKINASIEELVEVWNAKGLDDVMDDFRNLLRESIDGAKRVTAIIKDLKDFSNVDHADEQMADINSVIRSACNVLQGGMAGGIELARELSELPEIKCQPGYLGQVFMNILRNAEQAIEGKGRISVKSHSDDKFITVCISDTGTGMTDAVLSHAFEPFYTTRGVGQGTGLGLSVARDVIKAHGGDIDIKSRDGEGTTVSIVLPVVAGDLAPGG